MPPGTGCHHTNWGPTLHMQSAHDALALSAHQVDDVGAHAFQRNSGNVSPRPPPRHVHTRQARWHAGGTERGTRAMTRAPHCVRLGCVVGIAIYGVGGRADLNLED